MKRKSFQPLALEHHSACPGHPPHPLPFPISRQGTALLATLASGDQVDLAHLIPRMARAALKAQRPGASMAATLRETRVSFTVSEREAILDCAERVFQDLRQEGQEYLTLADAARLLGLPVVALRAYLRTLEGHRALGYPIKIGDEVRIPAAAVRPGTRREYLDSLGRGCDRKWPWGGPTRDHKGARRRGTAVGNPYRP